VAVSSIANRIPLEVRFAGLSKGLERAPVKVLDAISAWFRLDPKNSLMADKIDETNNGLGIVYAIGGVFSIFEKTIKCVQGEAGARVALARSSLGFISDLSSALKFLNYKIAGLARAAPFCDVGTYGIDVGKNLYEVVYSEGDDLGKKKWWQNAWELGKNGIYLGGAVAVVLGVALTPGVLFVLSVTALALSMIAIVAKQDVKKHKN